MYVCCSGCPLVYQDLKTCHDWPFKKDIVDLPIRMKENLKHTFGKFVEFVGGQNKDIDAASQTFLTEVKLLPWRRLYGCVIPVSAAFVFARVHLQRLEGGAMAFIWVSWLLLKQTENWSAPSRFSDPLLVLSTIRCWIFLHFNTSPGSERLYKYVNQQLIPFTNNQKLITYWATTPTSG